MPHTRTRIEAVTEDGTTMELVQRENVLEVLRGGQITLRSNDHGASGALAELALEPWRGRDDISVLVGALGIGHGVRAALDQPGVMRVDVVESSAAIIDWEARYFSTLNGAPTADPRTHVHRGDLGAFLQAPRLPDLPPDGWFVILIENVPLFSADEGLRIVENALRPGGILGLLVPARDDDLGRRLHARFQSVSRVTVPIGEGLQYVYRGRRGPRRSN